MSRVFFILAPDELKRLRSAKGDPSRRSIVADIEEAAAPEACCAVDKAWYYINSCVKSPRFPVAHEAARLAVSGGRQLHRGSGYVINLVTESQVEAVADALEAIGEDEFRAVFHAEETFAFNRQHFGYTPDEEKRRYCWTWFQRLGPFFRVAARTGRPVIFTVDCT